MFSVIEGGWVVGVGGREVGREAERERERVKERESERESERVRVTGEERVS